MKKQKLQTLQLNKKSISSLTQNLLKGGEDTTLYGCRWTENSWCDCPTEVDCTDTECHTVWDCEL
ncbi:hypothetical protein EZY14_014545 [Kordia sp. TARA_039_SRF]|jgi:hypothetical protein|nr:hypothetical protein EZY14_014545 [Kordia sp. TARA_039_SRF]